MNIYTVKKKFSENTKNRPINHQLGLLPQQRLTKWRKEETATFLKQPNKTLSIALNLEHGIATVYTKQSKISPTISQLKETDDLSE